MAFDGIVISNLSYELNTQLVGGRISKISMPEENELIFTIKNNAKIYRLLISASASLPLVYLTDVTKPAPKVAPAFLMLLRKYIGTAKLLVFNMYTTCIKQQHHLYNPFIYQLEIKRGIHRWYPPYRQISRSTLYRR